MASGETILLFRAIPRHLQFSAGEKRALKVFAQDLTEQISGGQGFTCLLTDNRELQRLNKSFLGHDFPTDVLSFPSDAAAEAGEIAISVERAEAQAQEFGHTVLAEVRILMLHGVLHLAGMDHERDEGEMERAEQRWRTSFSLPATLISRQPQ